MEQEDNPVSLLEGSNGLEISYSGIQEGSPMAVLTQDEIIREGILTCTE